MKAAILAAILAAACSPKLHTIPDPEDAQGRAAACLSAGTAPLTVEGLAGKAALCVSVAAAQVFHTHTHP